MANEELFSRLVGETVYEGEEISYRSELVTSTIENFWTTANVQLMGVLVGDSKTLIIQVPRDRRRQVH